MKEKNLSRKGETMTPQILLYNITDEKTRRIIKTLVLRLKIRVRIIEEEQYTLPLGSLVGLSPDLWTAQSEDTLPPNSNVDSSALTDEMLVFCFFSDNQLNQFLLGLRKNGISIPLKAVLTASNASWNSLLLYHEISEEHKKMHSR